MALNLFRLQLVCTQEFFFVFNKVLCIKEKRDVTLRFITDVVYIFDILMFILFWEESVTSVGSAQGLIFAL